MKTKGGAFMNSKYSYPAIFTPEKDGGFSVVFPDIENCFTCGDDLTEALFMAEDVLALMLYEYEAEKKPIPTPSIPSSIPLKDGEFVNIIACDTLEYRKRFDKTAVKKTLSIPAWLNTAATEANVNFSNVLQEALIEKLGLRCHS
jgi:predicted RNase H-like HicB family nuclease